MILCVLLLGPHNQSPTDWTNYLLIRSFPPATELPRRSKAEGQIKRVQKQKSRNSFQSH